MTFPCFIDPHDPADAKTFAFRFALNDGDQITSGSIEVVDPTGEHVISPTDITLDNIRAGEIDSYGAIFFRPAGGVDGIYWLRCVAHTALGDIYPFTMGLKVRAT